MDRSRTSALSRVLASGLLVVLGACGGGADTVQNPAGPGGAPATYTGPPPATADVQAFKINVWDNLKATNRCGQCHVGGGQTPQFVRQDDVNLAYEAANTVVTLSSPQDSQMVLKVGGGHNCWLASNEACADILTTWISNSTSPPCRGSSCACEASSTTAGAIARRTRTPCRRRFRPSPTRSR